MNQTQASDANTENVEVVEVFDNGTRLGFAELTDGRWSYPVTAFSAGEHRLTAKYKDITASQWVVNVLNRYFDDFQGFSEGQYQKLEGAFYTATATKNGNGSSPFFGPMQIYTYHWLLLTSLKDGTGHWGSETVISLKSPANEIIIDAYYRGDVNDTSVLEVVDEHGRTVERITATASFPQREMAFKSKDGTLLKTLKFTLPKPAGSSTGVFWWIRSLTALS